MGVRILKVQQSFYENVQKVYELMNFDEIILDYAINTIEESVEKLKLLRIDNAALTGEKALNALKTIRTNNSLEAKYNTMFNQCIVLLVSYFSSAVSDIFKVALTLKVNNNLNESLAKEEIKITLAEMQQLEIGLWDIGELFTMKREISFQDMQSISRVFKDYIGINLEKDADVNNIIVSQACRHGIVHLGNRIDKKMIKQVENAYPRTIKDKLKVGQDVQFIQEEIRVVGESMKKYVGHIVNKIGEIGIG